MTANILIVFGVLGGAVALFAWGRPRSDVVAILVVLALNLTGVLSIRESLAGFGDPVVVLIAAVAIVGEGLVATGVAYRLGEAVMRAGGSNEARLVALVMLLAGSIGAFMSSSAIVAMFIPVVMGITKKTGLNPKRMLMPLSVAALISGMMTLIASSPNLIIENTLRSRGFAPLGFFSWTPFGVAILATAIVFMLLFGRNMLSTRLTAEHQGPGQPSARDLAASYGLADKWHRLQVPGSSPLIDQTVAQAELLHRFGVVATGLEKHRHGKPHFVPAMPGTVFEPNDAILVVGSEQQAQQLVVSQGLVVLPELAAQQRHELFQELGVAEIMLAPESHCVGVTLREADFRSRYGLDVLAIRRRGEPTATNLDDQLLDFGDTLLVAGGWTNIRRLRDDHGNFFVLTLPAEFGDLMPARHQAPVAVGILVAMVVVMALELIPNAAAVMVAALALIASNCVKLDAIYRIINWKTVVLVAGTLPLATALAKTGATAMMAHGMVAALGSLGPLAVLATVFLVTSLVGLFISNAATAVLMAPVAIDAARALHDSPHAFAMTVALGCCAAYVTPVSSAVNMLVLEPGGYSFGDFVKLGVPLLLLTMIITVVLVSVIYRTGRAAIEESMAMATTLPTPDRVPDLKQGRYSDGHPLDEVQYLECKLILKPDRFTAAPNFFDYGRLVARTAKEFGIDFINKGVVLKPAIREVLFLDTADFRLYNNAFILRRRIRYEDGFPAGDPEIVFKFRHPDMQKAAELDVRPNIAGHYRIKFKGRGAAIEGSGGWLPDALLPQCAVSVEPGARRGLRIDGRFDARVPGSGDLADARDR